MPGKRLLLALMLVGLALVAISLAAISLYSSQHDWQVQRPCADCHADIENDLNSTTIHSTLACTDCHLNATLNYSDEHAGVVEECEACHLPTNTKYDDPNGTKELNYSTESHRRMYQNATQDSTMPGANEACIACHTRFNLELVWKRPEFYNYTFVDYTQITDFQANGQRNLYYTRIEAGRKHAFVSGYDVVCGNSTAGCHQDIYDAINDGGDAGHYNDIAGEHNEGTECWWCHWNSTEVADADFHASKYITCAYKTSDTPGGCHSVNTQNMIDAFGTIKAQQHSAQGDICMACHVNSAAPNNDYYEVYTEIPVAVWRDRQGPGSGPPGDWIYP
jgi:hypothetical protein